MPAVRINDIDIHYETFGTGKPLILLHGALMTRHTWSSQVYPLSAHYQVIVPDLRGHGDSGRSAGSYAVALLADDISKLIAALGFERAIVCGHSLGGMVAQELAISYPAQVSALILADTVYGTTTTFLETVQALLGWWGIALLPVERVAHAAAERHGKYNPEVASYLKREINMHARDKNNYLNIHRAALSFNSKTRLKYIDAPALVMVGEYNPPAHKQERAIARLIHAAQMEIVPGAGFMLHMDNPDYFTRTVLEFLDAVQRPRVL
ncbi:MAG: alpha/beta fold hydrolase [Anaerolinea sp.]|nr:alpha/beta fold hydrolase [Anaerolinea sp.]